MRQLRVVKGKTVEAQIASIDSILEGLSKKSMLMCGNLNKRNEIIPFSISGYVETCQSGDIICAYLSLAKVELKKFVVVVDKLKKDAVVFVEVHILSADGTDSAVRHKVKKGTKAVDDERTIQPGDKVSIIVKYEGEAPQGIWVAMRGKRA